MFRKEIIFLLIIGGFFNIYKQSKHYILANCKFLKKNKID